MTNEQMNAVVIVSRHQATIAWLIDNVEACKAAAINSGNVTIDDIKGKIVYGNLPMHLAAQAAIVYAVTFDSQPPRGVDLSAEDLEQLGVNVTPYKVTQVL